MRGNAHAACRRMEREDEQRDLEVLDKMTDSLGEQKMGDCQQTDPRQWGEIN